MNTVLTILIFLTMGALIVILGAGLWSMFKGGGNLSQKLMRARVIVQFIAIILLLVFAYFASNGS